jgi:hypothetical protein
VTGVQTCALPILVISQEAANFARLRGRFHDYKFYTHDLRGKFLTLVVRN